MTERIAIYGGAFDPPHLGHIMVIKRALECYNVDRLLVVPCGDPPHKQAQTPADARFAMSVAAFSDIPRVELSRQEIETPGPHYTVDTLRSLASLDADLALIVGTDEFVSFPKWKEPVKILEMARLAVASRPGFDCGEIAQVLAALPRDAHITFFPLEENDISSSDIRRLVCEGQSVAEFVSDAVADEIVRRGLYLVKPK